MISLPNCPQCLVLFSINASLSKMFQKPKILLLCFPEMSDFQCGFRHFHSPLYLLNRHVLLKDMKLKAHGISLVGFEPITFLVTSPDL